MFLKGTPNVAGLLLSIVLATKCASKGPAEMDGSSYSLLHIKLFQFEGLMLLIHDSIYTLLAKENLFHLFIF